MPMRGAEERPFDVQELKEYFFGDRQPVEEFDIDEVRARLEHLLTEGRA